MKTTQRKIRERRMAEPLCANPRRSGLEQPTSGDVRVIRAAVREVRGWLEAMKALIPLGAPRA